MVDEIAQPALIGLLGGLSLWLLTEVARFAALLIWGI